MLDNVMVEAFSEDEEKRSLDGIQKLTDVEIRKMEEMSKNKGEKALKLK